MDISLRFLGSLRVLIDGVHVHVERAQTRAVLALLARHPGTAIPAATLIDLLWEEHPPRQPIEALRTVTTRARKALGHDHLLRSIGTSYLLDLPGSSIDFQVFREAAETATGTEDLRAALALWNGVPFVDCGRNRRLELLADDLADRRWVLVERYVQMLLRQGQAETAVTFGMPLLDERPNDERLASLLTIGLARIGEEKVARGVIARVRSAARGDDPRAVSQTLDEAEERISTELLRRSTTSRTNRPITDPLSGHVVDLVGRDAELDRLRSVAKAARATGQAVILVGDPGVGKTTLAASFARLTGWRTWSIRCDNPPAEYLGMTSQLLSTQSSGAAEVAATLAPAVSLRLRQLSSRRPAVLICDDLQSASEVDLLVLRGLVRTGLAPDTLLIVTVRPMDGLSGQIAGIVADITREPNVTTIELDGLSRRAVRELARRIRPNLSARECTRLHELTRGNAFAVRSLCALDTFDVDQPIPDLPSALVQQTSQRIDALDRAAQDALELASLLDPPIDLGAVSALRDTDRLTLLETLRPAFERRVLVEDRPGDVRFDHELTRQAVQMRMPPVLRRAQHDRLAHLFERRGDVILAGHHLACALPDSDHARPAPLLLRAAETAIVAQRYRVAVECFESAERLLDPPTVRRIALRRGYALEQSGRRAAAADLYDQVAADSLAADDREGLARAALAGLAQAVVGGNRRRIVLLRTALDRPPDDTRLELELLVQLAAEETAAGTPPSPDVHVRAARLADDSASDQALLAFLDVLGVPFAPVDDEAVGRIERLAVTAAEGGDTGLVLRALEQRCAASIARGDLPQLRRSLGELDLRLRSHPSPRQRWAAALLRAMVADLEGGGVPAAEPLARAALDLGRDLDLPDAANAYAIFRLTAALRTGGLARLEPRVREATARRGSVPTWHSVHAVCLRDAGRPQDAIEAVDRFRLASETRRSVFCDVGYALAVAAVSGLPGDRPATELCSWAADQLSGWSGNLLVLGSGAGCIGPADLYLALATAPTPDAPETWAGPWLDGAWAELAAQLAIVASRRAT